MTLLEKITHVSLISLATIAGAIIILNRVSPPRPSSSQTPRSTLASSVGRKLPIDRYQSRYYDITLVLALKSDCQYCKKSLPLYRKMFNLSAEPDSHFSIYIFTEEDPPRIQEFLKHNGLENVPVFRVRFQEIGVLGTPTILVAGANRVVRKEFIGVLSTQDGDALLQDLSTGTI